ncbi:MAG: hypothetical protein J2P30_13475 [Actinobacteria bacterium]|nr:hypothetical protein [Actinomycetota bacterium]
MTGAGVPNGDMPNIPQSPLQGGSAVTDADLAALLAGKRDVAPWLRPVADVLAALSTEPSPAELTGEARALAQFRRRAGVLVPLEGARRGTAGLSSRLSTKIAAGATAAAVVLGGAATAAFAGVLPAPIQRFAHDAIGAPYAPSAPRHGPAHGNPAVLPGPLASHGTPAPSAKPHPTARDTDRHRQGKPRTSQSQGQQGQGQQGQGQQGQGQAQHGKGRGAAHGWGQSADGQGRGPQSIGPGNTHAQGQVRELHAQGQQGNPHPNSKSAPYRGRHARPARHAPSMDP